MSATIQGQPALALPAELTIYTVSELHPAWLEALATWLAGDGDPADGDAVCEVDAAGVAEVDAAGLQLLVALAAALARTTRSLRLLAPSAVLVTACSALGLGSLLSQPGANPLPGVPS